MNTEMERVAIQRLKAFEPKDDDMGYYLCYSGGKDSDCIRILAHLAGVRHEIHNNHTTVDAPETVRYIRSIPGIHIDYPEKSIWKLIVEKHMPPTRLVRYCCAELKEKGGKGHVIVTGVRWAESNNRKENADVVRIIGKPKQVQSAADEYSAEYKISKQGGLIMNDDNDESRRLVEHCYRTTKTMVNPIVDWYDKDVWDFLNHYGCESNPLYQCGFKRIGCIGCPMASKERYAEFARYPKYKALYIKAFDKMLENMPNRKNTGWQTGMDVFKWWMEEDPNQMEIDFEAGVDI